MKRKFELCVKYISCKGSDRRTRYAQLEKQVERVAWARTLAVTPLRMEERWETSNRSSISLLHGFKCFRNKGVNAVRKTGCDDELRGKPHTSKWYAAVNYRPRYSGHTTLFHLLFSQTKAARFAGSR